MQSLVCDARPRPYHAVVGVATFRNRLRDGDGSRRDGVPSLSIAPCHERATSNSRQVTGENAIYVRKPSDPVPLEAHVDLL